jgi:hypothetical protein
MSLPEGDVVRPPRKFENIVVKAAEWIDDNPPPQATDSNGLQYGMSMGAHGSALSDQASCTATSGCAIMLPVSETYWRKSRIGPLPRRHQGEPPFSRRGFSTSHAAEFDKPRRHAEVLST